MDAFVDWVRSTALSHAIAASIWIWPACETLHFAGLTAIIGFAGFFDLRLIGFFKNISVGAARDLLPFAIYGFAINVLTGVIFLIGHPEQYAHNRMWWWKTAFLAVAGLHMLVFEFALTPRAISVGANEDTSRWAKFAGALSLVSWFAVLYCGRMLPFAGSPY